MPPRNLAPAQTLPWRDWYSLQRWRTRAKHQLQVSPLCCLCEKRGRIVPAIVADHHPRHGGDYNKFMWGLCARSAATATTGNGRSTLEAAASAKLGVGF